MHITFDKSKLLLALDGINVDFKDKIVDNYIELKKRYLRSFFNDEYDTVGLSSGKFCETVFRMLQQEITGSYVAFEKHISNFPAEINKLTQSPAGTLSESLRVIIPRGLVFIYTLRNKRGIGHVGGDIEANSIDIGTIVKSIDWVICELIRIYHNLPLDEAQKVIDSLNLKLMPDLWSFNGKKRVLNSNLKFGDKVLILLYNELSNSAHLNDLFDWTEHSNKTVFKSSILKNLHKEKLIDFDVSTNIIMISPKGLSIAESLVYKS